MFFAYAFAVVLGFLALTSIIKPILLTPLAEYEWLLWLATTLIRYGSHSRVKKMGIEKAERRQPIPNAQSNDSFYFSGTSKDGLAYWARLGLRNKDGSIGSEYAEVWFYVRIPGVGILKHCTQLEEPALPTRHPATETLSFRCLEPMARWEVTFAGECVAPEGARYDVSFKGIWCVEEKMSGSYFDFDVDLEPHPLAESWARMPSFFRSLRALRDSHQTHYEQHGTMDGTLEATRIGPGPVSHISTRVLATGMRDHSFGARDWGYMHRWMVYFGQGFNGYRFSVAMVDHPESSTIQAGYVWTPEDGFSRVVSCNPPIALLGEYHPRSPPRVIDFTWDLRKPSGELWTLCGRVTVTGRCQFDMGPGKNIFYEQFANYEFYTLGSFGEKILQDKGSGVLEFAYGQIHVDSDPMGSSITCADNLLETEWADRTLVNTALDDLNEHLLVIWLTHQEDVNKEAYYGDASYNKDGKYAKRSSSLPPYDRRRYATSLVGGKGSGLASLHTGRFSVPAAFAISTASYRFQRAASGIASKEDALLRQLERCGNDGPKLADVTKQLRMLWLRTPLVREVAEVIARAYERLGGIVGDESSPCVAVRSSATAEDLEDASFAGQHDTILGVRGVAALHDAIKSVWASVWAERAVAYRSKNGIDHKDVWMCVVVQQCVEADAAGVVFTCHPVTQDADQVVVTAAHGLGESVVAGHVTPDTYVLSRDIPAGQDAPPLLTSEIGHKPFELRVVASSTIARMGEEDDGEEEEPAEYRYMERVPCDSVRASSACLSSGMVERIASLALEVEAYHRAAAQQSSVHVDIEFAVLDEQVYLLQARPVTTMKNSPGGGGGGGDDDDDDDDHSSGARGDAACLSDLDTALPFRDDVYTLYNIGEILPGVVTPLTTSAFGYPLELAMRCAYGLFDDPLECETRKGLEERMRWKFVGHFSGRLFLNLSTLYRVTYSMLASSPQAVDLSIMGHVSTAPRPPRAYMRQRAMPGITTAWSAFRSSNTYVSRICVFTRWLYNVLGCIPTRMSQLEKLCALNHVEMHQQDEPTALGVWESIDRSLVSTMSKAWTTHLWASAESSMLAVTCQEILGGISAEHSAIVSALLGNIGGVDSAAVVTDLSALVEATLDDVEEDERVNDAIDQLVDPSIPLKQRWDAVVNASEGPLFAIGERVRRYLDEHGHRCFREAEIRTRGWSDAPLDWFSMCVASLRAGRARRRSSTPSPSASQGDEGHESHPGDPAASDAHARVNALFVVKRWIFQAALSRARTAVQHREHTKALCIRLYNQYKRAYRLLSESMVSEGILPDGDLLYYFTHEELGDICRLSHAMRHDDDDDDARDISRDDMCAKSQRITQLLCNSATRRRKSVAQDSLTFPQICRPGRPFPIPSTSSTPVKGDDTDEQSTSHVVLQGTAVSTGKVTARVRVVRSVQDASLLEEGEILVVPYTDIGWTPYFTIIGGLITEIGGIVSHGAVVAREYGIPCCVNVRDATRLFHTGDMVCLDANLGKITILDE